MTGARVRVVVHLPHRQLAVFRALVLAALQPHTPRGRDHQQRELPAPKALELGLHQPRAWGRVEALVLTDMQQLEADVLGVLRRALYPGHHGLLELVSFDADPEALVPLTRIPPQEGP